MKVLIIEDELLVQQELIRIIEKRFPDMNIVGTLFSVKESIEWLSLHKADLIFMDIHLSDGISFDIFEQVNVKTPIIFTTAYDQYAIKAFQVNGIGYLLKPITEKDLVSSVEKLETLSLTSDIFNKLLESVYSPKEYKSRIAIKSGDKLSFLNMADVAYFFAEDRLTFVVSRQGRKQIVDYTIETIEPMLDPKQFFRISRGCIASIDAICSVSKYFNSRLKISLQPKYEGELLISRVRVPEFLKWLNDE